MADIKRKQQLGIDPGTAAHRLRKELLFKYIKKAGDNFCFQCGAEIDTIDELSIEHKKPWLDSEDPIELFFNLENIAFSHSTCNYRAARKPHKLSGLDDPRLKHGNASAYGHGCKCSICKAGAARRRREVRAKKRGLLSWRNQVAA